LHQVGDLFELNVKLWCQKVKEQTGEAVFHNTISVFVFTVPGYLHSMF